MSEDDKRFYNYLSNLHANAKTIRDGFDQVRSQHIGKRLKDFVYSTETRRSFDNHQESAAITFASWKRTKLWQVTVKQKKSTTHTACKSAGPITLMICCAISPMSSPAAASKWHKTA